MVGGNRAGDGEWCSLSFELYCCYRFPIRKKDGPLYWPTTSMKVCLNHTGQQRPSSLGAIHIKCDTVQWHFFVCAWLGLLPVCMMCLCFCAPEFMLWLVCMMRLCFCAPTLRIFVSFVSTGLCARWLPLPKEVHQVQLSCVLANADQNYALSPPSSTPLW